MNPYRQNRLLKSLRLTEHEKRVGMVDKRKYQELRHLARTLDTDLFRTTEQLALAKPISSPSSSDGVLGRSSFNEEGGPSIPEGPSPDVCLRYRLSVFLEEVERAEALTGGLTLGLVAIRLRKLLADGGAA